jgi:hypothetical protein
LLGLVDGSGESVEHEPSVAGVSRGERFRHQVEDQLVGDQLAGVHDRLEFDVCGRVATDHPP